MSLHAIPQLRTLFLRASVLVSLLTIVACHDDAPRWQAQLDSLEFSGARTALNPAFSPDIQRYSVISAEMPGTISVTPTATTINSISINGAIASSNTAFPLDGIAPGDVVRIRVEGSGAYQFVPREYEIVYLPTDFPEFTTTVSDPNASDDPLYISFIGPVRYVAILDNNGVPEFFRREDNLAFDFKWHEATRERSYARFDGTVNEWGRRDSEIVILDADFNEIDVVQTIGLSHTDQHDFLINEQGEFVFVSYDGSNRDLSAFGLTTEEVVEDSVIQVVDRATRQVIFEWNSWGQVPWEDQTYPNQRGEYAHVNSVFEDTDGGIIISARGTSQVVKISRPGGQIVWKLGGRTNQFQFIDDPLPHLCGQHTASRLENGNLLVFDNGQNCWPIIESRGNFTRVAEYELNEQELTARLVWSYSQEGAYSTSQGSAQRLDNGNTLIGWGRGPDVFATEVNADGEKVFELTAFHEAGDVIPYRVRRYPQ